MAEKHFIRCYGGDLQRSIVLSVRLLTYNRVMLRVARILGIKLAPSNKKFWVRPWFNKLDSKLHYSNLVTCDRFTV